MHPSESYRGYSPNRTADNNYLTRDYPADPNRGQYSSEGKSGSGGVFGDMAPIPSC